MERRKSKKIKLANTYIGGDSEILVQSMLNVPASDIEGSVAQAKELAAALNEAYGLGVDLSDINNCYLKAQNPIMLLKGNRTLKEFGVRNGTIISMAE